MPTRSASSPTALLGSDQRHVAAPLPPRSGTLAHVVLGWSSLVARLLGAVAVLIVGVIHLQAHDGPYAAVPTIGELFILNFVAATVIGAALLLPLERIAGRWSGIAVTLVTLAGIGLAAGSFVMLIISEHGTLFGFHEPGYDPGAISRSRTAELIAVGLLTVSLAVRPLARARPRW